MSTSEVLLRPLVDGYNFKDKAVMPVEFVGTFGESNGELEEDDKTGFFTAPTFHYTPTEKYWAYLKDGKAKLAVSPEVGARWANDHGCHFYGIDLPDCVAKGSATMREVFSIALCEYGNHNNIPLSVIPVRHGWGSMHYIHTSAQEMDLVPRDLYVFLKICQNFGHNDGKVRVYDVGNSPYPHFELIKHQ